MSPPTPDEVQEAVKILNRHLQLRNVSTQEYFKGFEATFELLGAGWASSNIDPIWREGYEQCMTDIVDALSDEWGVPVWFEEPGCIDPEEE